MPKTADSFVVLCEGRPGVAGYKGTKMHRIVPNFMIQAGQCHADGATDEECTKVNGGRGFFGDVLEDENFVLKHDSAGVLSMVSNGPNTATTQFFFTAGRTSWLDGSHVVFGFVRKGHDLIAQIQEMGASVL